MRIVTLIPGDGIGPEVTEAMKKVVATAGANIEWDEVEAGEAQIESYGTPLPPHVIDSIKKNLCLKILNMTEIKIII